LSETETISTPSNEPFVFDDSDYFNMYSYLKLDTHDDKYYPKKGFFIAAKFKWYISSSDYNNDFRQFSQAKGRIGFAKAISKKTTFLFESEAGFTLGEVNSTTFDFLLGGYNQNFINNFIPFYGYDINALSEQSFLKSTFNFRFDVTENQFLHVIANYARVDSSVLEGGDLFDDTKSGYALGYSLNSILGPIDLKYSWSPDTNKTYWYFNLGFWF
jgi:NTE family protein